MAGQSRHRWCADETEAQTSMKIRHLVIAAIIAATALFTACERGLPSDAELTARLVGKWRETRQFDNERHEQVMHLNGDGSFVITGVKTESGVVTNFRLRGQWRVQNGYFWYETLSSEPPEVYPPGEEYKDRIVSISESAWVMIEESTGQESRALKLIQ
jgi:hypothetical protein